MSEQYLNIEVFRRLESIGGDVIVRESQIHGVVCVQERCDE